MRVAFVGKGGSGKTTLSSLFARYLNSQKLPVLAIDADINQHLKEAINPNENYQMNPLGNEIDKIKEVVKSKNKRIKSVKSMVKTTPPGRGSKLLLFKENHHLYSFFEKEIDGIRVMETGPFTEEDLGVACYHSKTGAVELLLNHLIDSREEYIVIDMTAGADSFASGLFTKFDLTILVCEPTLKSIRVYKQYSSYAKTSDINLKVVGNKIENKEDMDFIKSQVGKDYLGSFYNSDFVKLQEKGHFQPISNLEKNNTLVLESILSELDKAIRDWDKYYQQTVYFHRKNALDWANDLLGEDLTLQIDPQFNLREEVEKYVN